MVKDLSSEGVMAETSAPLRDGDLLRLGFTEHEMLDGRVVWSVGGRLGIKFDRPIDISEILVGSTPAEPTRAPRLPINCTATISDTFTTRRDQVVNVSTKGLQVKSSAFKVGDKLTVEITGLERKKAVVRWTGAGETGLEFLIPLTYGELQCWTIQHYSSEQAA